MASAIVIIIGGCIVATMFAFGIKVLRADSAEYRYYNSQSTGIKDVFSGKLLSNQTGILNDSGLQEGIAVNSKNEWVLQTSLSDEAIDSIFRS